MAAAKFKRPEPVRDCLDPSLPLRRRIEAERRRLQKALAILTALVYAMNHEAIDIDEAGDVASVVRELIERATVALDATELARDKPTHPASPS